MRFHWTTKKLEQWHYFLPIFPRRVTNSDTLMVLWEKVQRKKVDTDKYGYNVYEYRTKDNVTP